MATTKKKLPATATKTTKAKPPVKKVIPTPPIVEKEIEEIFADVPLETTISMQKKMNSQPRIKKGYVGIIALVLVIIFLLYTFKSQFVVATVNGQPISRYQFTTEMQKESGKKSMDALITKVLILQEAKKKNISVSDSEVNDQIKIIQNQLKKQGQSLDKALEMQGLTMVDLKEQIKIGKLIEKLLGKKVAVTDKEINDYMEKAEQESQNSGQENAPKLSKDMVKQQLKQAKMGEAVQPWLLNLQQTAKIAKFLNL